VNLQQQQQPHAGQTQRQRMAAAAEQPLSKRWCCARLDVSQMPAQQPANARGIISPTKRASSSDTAEKSSIQQAL
jgi:hypothetical protein